MRIVIVEDETAAAVNLTSLLNRMFPYMNVAAQLESVTETVEWLSRNETPDLMFMDIHLADGSAFTVFSLTEVKCPVIFTTAYDSYALEAFRVNSIDYLLKPIKEEDLARAVDKLNTLTGTGDYLSRIGEMVAAQKKTQALLVYVKDRIVPQKIDEIAYLYSSNENVVLCTRKGESFQFDKTLDWACAQLPADDFFRANRQFIIARDAIEDISIWFGGRLSVNMSVAVPERIIISKAKAAEFKRWLAGM